MLKSPNHPQIPKTQNMLGRSLMISVLAEGEEDFLDLYESKAFNVTNDLRAQFGSPCLTKGSDSNLFYYPNTTIGEGSNHSIIICDFLEHKFGKEDRKKRELKDHNSALLVCPTLRWRNDPDEKVSTENDFMVLGN